MHLTRREKYEPVLLMTLAVLFHFSGFFLEQLVGGIVMPLTISMIIIGWMLLVRHRVAELIPHRLLTLEAAMMLVMMLIRACRYLLFLNDPGVARYLWYFYYVPILLISLISFITAVHATGTPKEENIYPVTVTTFVTVLLIIGVVTNDYHQLCFRFHSVPFSEDNYSHEFLFYMVWGWSISLYTVCCYMMLSRNRNLTAKSLAWTPLIPVFVGLVILAAQVVGLDPHWHGEQVFHLAEVFAYMTIGFWEVAARIGLLPCNTGFQRLFAESSVRAELRDSAGNTVYVTRALQLPANPEHPAEYRKHKDKINGGSVCWEDDVTELKRMNAQLAEVREELREESELLQAETRLKEERLEIAEQNRIYDELAVLTRPQNEKIAALAEEAERQPEKFRENLGKICFYGTYIKRRANLTLLAEKADTMPAGELCLSISETMRALKQMGIVSSLHGMPEGQASSQLLLRAYDDIQLLLEQALPGLRGMIVSAKETETECLFRISLEEPTAVPSLTDSGIELLHEDGSCYVTLHVPLEKEVTP